ncbi:uncharacterized protein LOC135401627 [Ornithodoros turicata]|uniref:uncharacterized protein LOC135401627 n=1 Tax=Ornithodoros turicata TaxID=34597 RepID=UPI00313889FF
MLTRIFPVSDTEAACALRSSSVFLLGTDQDVVTSLALQAAVTTASEKEYVAILGNAAVKKFYRVHGMPQYEDSMVDFIRPRFFATTDSLCDYFIQFHMLPTYPDLIVLLGLEEFVKEASKSTTGDQEIIRLLAFLLDVAHFASKKNGRPCRILTLYAGSEGEPGNWLHRFPSLRATRLWCESQQQDRFTIGGYGTGRLTFCKEGNLLRLQQGQPLGASS